MLWHRVTVYQDEQERKRRVAARAKRCFDKKLPRSPLSRRLSAILPAVRDGSDVTTQLDAVVTKSHDLLLSWAQGERHGEAPREVLVRTLPPWGDTRTAWPIADRLVDYAREHLWVARKRKPDAASTARAEDVYVVVLRLYDEIRLQCLEDLHVTAPHYQRH